MSYEKWTCIWTIEKGHPFINWNKAWKEENGFTLQTKETCAKHGLLY